MDLFASLLATPASDALRDVDQDCSSGCHDFYPFRRQLSLRQEKLFHHFLPQLRCKPRKQTTDRASAILGQRR